MNRAEREQYLRHIEQRGVSLGLDRIRAACADAGDPQRACPSVIVAGTNGKGSVSTLLYRLARAHGVAAGLYTSPNFTKVNERIAFDGADICDGELDALVGSLTAVGDRHDLTFFELFTLAAFRHFADRRAELAVYEVGMGGRLDATNAADADAAVLTPIALDHTAELGPDTAAIAREKAGVVRPGRPVVSARQDAAAADVIARACAGQGCALTREGEEFSWERRPAASLDAPETFDYRGPGLALDGLMLGLKGIHQASNGAVALAAFSAIAGRLGVAPDEARIREALRGAAWPGRFQVIPGDPPIVLDGAHNPHGAAALRAALGERAPGRAVHLVFGALEDKDYRLMAATLAPLARDVTVLRPSSARAASVESVASAFRAAGVEPAIAADIGAALEGARARAKKTGGLVVASGSLYLVGMVLRALD